jgi:hypothetical protein
MTCLLCDYRHVVDQLWRSCESGPGGRRLPEQWAAPLGLTGLHAIDWAIVCSLIYNRNLACGEGTRLDCCDMITIITLARLYFVLSCRLTPTDAVSIVYE